MGIERQRPTRFWLVAALSSALALALVPTATPKTLVPAPPTTFFGVSDRGSVAEFKEFAGFVDKHPAVLQTFHPWGNSLKQALPRWQAVNVRPMLHISTQDDETLAELITPKAIARGRGDNYLLRLNHVLAKNDVRIYLRPLGEPNRCLNAWAGLDCGGGRRGGSHSYKLVQARLPPDRPHRPRRRHPRADEPAPAGGRRPGAQPPRRQRAAPAGPGPGGERLEPAARRLAALAGQPAAQLLARGALGRLGGHRLLLRVSRTGATSSTSSAAAAGTTSPSPSPSSPSAAMTARGSCAASSHWAYRRSRVRMLVYYRGFGESGNDYRLGLYPDSTRALRRRLDQVRFPAYAPAHATKPDRVARADWRAEPAPHPRSATPARSADPTQTAAECAFAAPRATSAAHSTWGARTQRGPGWARASSEVARRAGTRLLNAA